MADIGAGEWIVIGLSLIIGVFFLVGNWLNNQRADDAMRWLRQAISSYGELKSSRFSAPTSKGIAFQIIPSERCPFQRIQGVLVLERRENLPLWIFNRLRGKRDMLQLTSDLPSAPASDLHICQKAFLPKANTGSLANEGAANWVNPVGTTPFYLMENEPPIQVERVSQQISRLPAMVVDLALKRKSPHIAFKALLPPLLQSDPKSFLQTLLKAIEPG